MIKLTLEFATYDELHEAVEKLTGGAVGVRKLQGDPAVFTQTKGADEPLPEIQPETLDKLAEMAAPAKAEAPKEQPPADPAATTSSEKHSESVEPAAAAEVTYDDLKAVIMKAIANGKTALVKEACAACSVKTFQGTTDPALWSKAKALIEAGL